MKDAGDTEALNRFYDEYPESVTRQATFKDDPEALLRFTLYTKITDRYYNLDKANQQAAVNTFGGDFQRSILNKETRNYNAVDIQKLAYWAQALSGSIPNLPQFEQLQGLTNEIQYYSDPVVDSVRNYYKVREQLHPGQAKDANEYWKLPIEDRKDWDVVHPGNKEYRAWNYQFKQDNPLFKSWDEDRKQSYDAELAADVYGDMPESVLTDFTRWVSTGKPMRESTNSYLKQLWQTYANTNFNTYEDFLQILKWYR